MLKPGEFQAWADEGFVLAIEDVYPGFGVNEAVSAEYQQRAEYDCRTRIMYGGERLAALLVQIFGESETFMQ